MAPQVIPQTQDQMTGTPAPADHEPGVDGAGARVRRVSSLRSRVAPTVAVATLVVATLVVGVQILGTDGAEGPPSNADEPIQIHVERRLELLQRQQSAAVTVPEFSVEQEKRMMVERSQRARVATRSGPRPGLVEGIE